VTEIEDPDWTTPEEAEEFVVKLKARIRVLEAALRAILEADQREGHTRAYGDSDIWLGDELLKQVREALNEAK